MGENQGAHAERDAQHPEKCHEHHAQNDFGGHEGQAGEVFDHPAAAGAHPVEPDGTQRAHHPGGKTGGKPQNQAVAQRLEHGLIRKQGAVPFQREAAPHAGKLALVEGVENDQGDGQIDDDQPQGQINRGKGDAALFFHSRPSSRVVWVTRLYSPIIRLVRSISTTLSAAAKGQLWACSSWS